MENGFLILNENQIGSQSQVAQSTDLKIDQVSSKHCFEVVDRTDEVSHIYTERRS
ncbi:hypothetical protein [Streptococcus pneumoniae]|uniref:hypothetical protein n=1 Tax=Streptococcus pneumoniae TaxID=1313 RepID=UPI001364A145|nr:hypothetical protein [Streptococcus pneumoniae]